MHNVIIKVMIVSYRITLNLVHNLEVLYNNVIFFSFYLFQSYSLLFFHFYIGPNADFYTIVLTLAGYKSFEKCKSINKWLDHKKKND